MRWSNSIVILIWFYLNNFSHIYTCVHGKSKSASSLSTFRTENLKISLPIGCSSIFEEAFMIMKSYFLHRNNIKEDDWETLKLECTKIKVVNHLKKYF